MKRVILIATTILVSFGLSAKPTIGEQKRVEGLKKTASGCNQTSATIDLDINNVRARIMTGGDAWWDRAAGAARYEVPKGGNANALFAGSIWIGGIDQSTNTLRVAAQTYRTRGNDYWTGPLDEFNGASVDFQTCSEWDRFWKINQADINAFKTLAEGCNNDPACIFNSSNSIPDVIKEWPGRSANSESGSKTAVGASGSLLNVPDREMAPFVDVDGDNVYNWLKGDYPDVLGDQYIWYVFNDKGDAKTQTQSDAIGVEIHLGAFAFATSDCLNDATFYNYRVHNWSTSIIDSTYMATWTDADMGYAFDDFIGCDTARGLGILYNGDGFDETGTGYGFDIPMVGVDFFRGPRIDNPDFPLASNKKFIELKMSVFTYFNNGTGRDGDPQIGNEFYNYMTGSWRDGSEFKIGCDPLNGGGVAASSVYPADPCKGGVSEPDCNRTPFDRRFVHSAGPFQLIPGIVPSDITIGCVWVPDAGAGKSACFSKILACDDKSQDLFDRDFQLPFGPQAPDVTISPLDRKLVLQLSNPESSNNVNELYGIGTDLVDSLELKFFESIPKTVNRIPAYADSVYKFEGYIVYQLQNANVAFSEIRSKDGTVNTDVARIVYQGDLENHIDNLLNYEIDPEISADFYTPKLMVSGANEGIKHSLQISEDAFATGTSKELINYKTYYYMAVAYAYNKFDNDDVDAVGATPQSAENEFDPSDANNTQNIQYLESRTDGRELPIKIVSATPHPAYDSMYAQNYAEYGTGIQLTQVEGRGNGGRELELTMATINEILYGGNNQDYTPTYQGNMGPADVFVTVPDSLRAGKYELYLDVEKPNANADLGADAETSYWKLRDASNGNIIDTAKRSILRYNDQLLQSYGLSIGMEQVLRPGDRDTVGENGYITSTVTFADINLPWLSGIPDAESSSLNNWIRAGEDFNPSPDPVELGGGLECIMGDWPIPADRIGKYENIISGTWAPYAVTVEEGKSECGNGVSYSRLQDRLDGLMQIIQSVDIVFTSDKSLWTKCPVVDMTDHVATTGFGEGGQAKFNVRKHASWDKGVDDGGNPSYASDSGYSWFPGYALNIETGERLNVMFSEESFNGDDKGNDMIWNPTSTAYDPINGNLRWGGKHFVYVLASKYDQGEKAMNLLRTADGQPGSKFTQRNRSLEELYESVMWVGNVLSSRRAPLLSLEEGLIPTETKVRIRVERPYDNYLPDPNYTPKNGGWPLYAFSTENLAPALLGDGRNDFTDRKDELLDMIQPVPNPYYAYSGYETDRLDNRIKIINLPEKATLKIYTIDGTLVRTLQKTDPGNTFIDWDLKNNKNIPIASGMYLIHVNIEGVGERVLKWFGAMKPVDITSQ